MSMYHVACVAVLRACTFSAMNILSMCLYRSAVRWGTVGWLTTRFVVTLVHMRRFEMTSRPCRWSNSPLKTHSCPFSVGHLLSGAFSGEKWAPCAWHEIFKTFFVAIYLLLCLNNAKFGQLILCKIVPNWCNEMSDFKAKMHQIRFRWRNWQRSSRPLAGFKGAYF